MTGLTHFTDCYFTTVKPLPLEEWHHPVKKYLDVTSTRPVNWTMPDPDIEYLVHIGIWDSGICIWKVFCLRIMPAYFALYSVAGYCSAEQCDPPRETVWLESWLSQLYTSMLGTSCWSGSHDILMAKRYFVCSDL